MKLFNKTIELTEALKRSDTSKEIIQSLVGEFFQVIKSTASEDEIQKSMYLLTQLFGIENEENGVFASIICGSLIEDGFPAIYVSDEYIRFYKGCLEKAKPFLDLCQERCLDISDDKDEYDVLEALKTAFFQDFHESIRATECLDKYHLCGIALFSSDKQEFQKGKDELGDILNYPKFIESFHWFSELFKVQFDEPLLVIDLNSRKGLLGRMNGIVDNFQLQLLLMGLDELNEEILLDKSDLEIVRGYGPQSTERSVIGKWNLYNWEYLKVKNWNTKEPDLNHSVYWIWGEGTPDDISLFQGYRVVLLDYPPYQRILNIQRTFKNLKASIQVEQLLSPKEIDQWIEAFIKA